MAKKLGLPKAPPRPTKVRQPPPLRRVVRRQVRRRAPVVRARGRG